MARRNIISIAFAGLLLSAATQLTACSMDSPTFFSQKRVEVVEETYSGEFETAAVDKAILEGIGRHYLFHGEGPVNVVVTYNPKGKSGNTAMNASDAAARIASALHKHDIKDVKTDILPIHESDKSMTSIEYMMLRAQAPTGCSLMEDVDDSRNENYRDYQLGCSTESFIAQQVAKPKDLLGRVSAEEPDARIQANTVELYKGGADLSTEVESESASN